MGWARLQSAGANGAASSPAVTYGTNLSSTTLLVAVVTVYQDTTTAVKDAALNSFTKIQAEPLNGSTVTNGELSLWVLATPAGDVGAKPAITATCSTANPAGWGMLIQEVSGLVATADGTAGVATGTNGTVSPSYTSGAASEYLVSVYGDQQAVAGTPTLGGSGWTTDTASQSSISNMACCLGYKNSTHAAETDGWTGSSGCGPQAAIMVAVQLAAFTPAKGLLIGFP